MSANISDSIFKYRTPAEGDEIVISGMAGCFPGSENVDKLRDNLYNKVDLMGECRWSKNAVTNIPTRCGTLRNDISRFDANYFGIHFKQAHSMDPQGRVFIEKCYEALYDAGINPKMMSNTKTGVYVGACMSETEKMLYENFPYEGFGLTGCSRAMIANRVSYCLGLTGPSYSTDTACASSMYAMENAFKAILSGEIDAAIVGGCNLCLHPLVTKQFFLLGVLSADATCKVFDEGANGYVRSEGISCLILQRAKHAKRIYAEVVHAKTNCDGYKPEGITFPSWERQKTLLDDFYKEINFAPENVDYIEAHGTGTKVGDPAEIKAIDSVFCSNAKIPILLGSVKSNIGHSEAASGMHSVIKSCFAMYYGHIAPNLHFNKPSADLKAIAENRLKVITEKVPFEGDYIACNSFGFGGANAHLLLKRFRKNKINNGKPNDDLPRLVCVSGRTKESITHIIDTLQSQPIDAEYIALYHDIFKADIPGHTYRGYTILQQDDKKPSSSDQTHFKGSIRPVWFIFSGMGSQWPGMGKSLMRIPTFAESIARCDSILRPHGVDIYEIILNEDPKVFDNILSSFVGITAIQMALVDVLFAVGIRPDYIIGHSVGELGCAYADGCFTSEQLILAAYSRGKASLETEFIHGAMAAVGLGYDKLKSMCPQEIDIACRNSSTSCTISGPHDAIKQFVAKLESQNIFVRTVNSANIAYHSRYISKAGPTFLAALEKVIPSPKPRSSKWKSTSIPKCDWNTPLAKYSSAEYHTNNLLSPVLFEETAHEIQEDAVCIEIAPHGLLQAIVKRSFPTSVANFSLTQRGEDNVRFMLNTLGKLYNVGLTPDLSEIYPKIQFPVSCGTPAISPHILWDHSEEWNTFKYESNTGTKPCERSIVFSLADPESAFVSGHIVNGRNLFPATGYIYMVWESLSIMHDSTMQELPVIFENIRFVRATTVPPTGTVSFQVMLHRSNGTFEVMNYNETVVTGKVTVAENPEKEMVDVKSFFKNESNDTIPMTKKDVYKELRLRGYNYKGLFRSIEECNIAGSRAFVSWHNNWVAFIDCMLQMAILNHDTRNLYVPTMIQTLIIDPKRHEIEVEKNHSENNAQIPCYYDRDLGIFRSEGVEIRGLHITPISKRPDISSTVLEKYEFVPYEPHVQYSDIDALRILTQIILENTPHQKLKIIENHPNSNMPLLSPKLIQVLEEIPLIQNETFVLSKEPIPDIPDTIKVINREVIDNKDISILIDSNLLQSTRGHATICAALRAKGGYIIFRETRGNEQVATNEDWQIIAKVPTDDEILVLIAPKEEQEEKENLQVVEITNTCSESVEWLKSVKEAMTKNAPLIIYGNNEPLNGLMGFVNCLRREPGGENIRAVFVMDKNIPKFYLNLPFYRDQLSKQLAINVYKNGSWGTFRHLQYPLVEKKVVPHTYVNLRTHGDLQTLNWYEGPLEADAPDCVEVVYSALNFRDIMHATGKLSSDYGSKALFDSTCDQGLDFAGFDSNRNRVMGFVPAGALATRVHTSNGITWSVPQSWSLADAATVPVVYSTVWVALVHIGEIKPGMKVLIHAGTGGVGQAAINVALHFGCTVFTTVGTEEKRAFVRKTWPVIRDEHIGNSRDRSFEYMIKKQTHGAGVDIVLNSLAEEKLHASLRCLGEGGKFLEIGKYDLSRNNEIGLQIFLKRTSFHGIILDNYFNKSNPDRARLHAQMTKAIESGAIKPLVHAIFKSDEIIEAYRYMASGKHMGKVLIEVRKEDDRGILPPTIAAIPRFFCNSAKSYVIVGGLGGFGLELIGWLVSRGACNIVIVSRRGISNGYQAWKVRSWQKKNIHIEILTENVSTLSGVESILRTTSSLGPVDGIFNLAAILNDALFENQTEESFKTSLTAKAIATKYLDEVSRKMCPNLRHFVVFSSVSCGRGNPGQTNYGMANSVMERICEQRTLAGLPALAVQWGAIGDVGLVADMQDNDKILEIGGTLQQRIDSCLDTLDTFMCASGSPVVASMVVAEKKAANTGNIVHNIAIIMGLKDLKSVNLQATLPELGMDSMMAVEIKQTLERELGVNIAAKEMRTLTFAKLMKLAEESSVKLGENNSSASVCNGKLINFLPVEEMSSEILVHLPNANTSSKNCVPIFFLPGIEGASSYFKKLAEKLPFKAFGLQYPSTSARPDDVTVESMAQTLLPLITSNLKSSEPFQIVGHSFGTLVAFELALLLEALGYHGRLLCIDGSPEMVKLLGGIVTTYNQTDLQMATIISLTKLFTTTGSEEIYREYNHLTTWEDRKRLAYENAQKNEVLTSFSYEYVSQMMDGILNRVTAILSYNTTSKQLKTTQIRLARADERSITNINEDYALSKLVITGNVDVTVFEGDHFTIIENANLPEYVKNTFSC